MKTAYLADQRRRGDGSDPFLEADRRETARQEAAAKRVHPTLHLPVNSQPSAQVGGSFTNTATGALVAPQTSAVTSASSGGGLSLFSTPSSAPASSMSSSLFATPATSASASSLFGSGVSPQMSSSSLFAASTLSLFGSTVPSFGSTTSAGASLFSTPFASGILILFSFKFQYLQLQSNGHFILSDKKEKNWQFFFLVIVFFFLFTTGWKHSILLSGLFQAGVHFIHAVFWLAIYTNSVWINTNNLSFI